MQYNHSEPVYQVEKKYLSIFGAMARNKGNVLTRKYSGKAGNILLHKNGIMRTIPDMSKRILSDKQKAHLTRFEQAKTFARQVLSDPVQSARYGEMLAVLKKRSGIRNIGIYQLAIREYMRGNTDKE